MLGRSESRAAESDGVALRPRAVSVRAESGRCPGWRFWARSGDASTSAPRRMSVSRDMRLSAESEDEPPGAVEARNSLSIEAEDE